MLHSRQNVNARSIFVAVSVFLIAATQTAPAQQWTCHYSNGTPWEGGHDVTHAAFIPGDHVYPPPVSGCTYGGQWTVYLYKGDPGAIPPGYGPIQSARVYNTADFQYLWKLKLLNFDVGQTNQYGYHSPANGSTLSAADQDNLPNDCLLWNQSTYAKKDGMHGDITLNPTNGTAHLYGSGANPLEFDWFPITWDITTRVDWSNLDYVTAKVTHYHHTCYPSHIVYVNDWIVYRYDAPSNDTLYITGCLSGVYAPIDGSQTAATHVPCN